MTRGTFRIITACILALAANLASAATRRPQHDDGAVVLGAIVVAALVGLAALWFYVWSLVDAARNDRWVWFVMMLFVGPLCVLYVIFGRTGTPKRLPEQERREPF
jgi:hypothetical protein